MELAAVNRTNYLIDPKSQKRHKLTYSYIGPVLIGMGGKGSQKWSCVILFIRLPYSLALLPAFACSVRQQPAKAQ